MSALRCKAKCKGWVVVIDRKKGVPDWLHLPPGIQCRWIVAHRPNGAWAGADTRLEARELLRQTASGVDPEGILPKEIRKASDAGSPPSGSGSPPSGNLEGSRVRARKPPPSLAAQSLPPPADPTVFHLEFKREMLTKFNAERISGLIEGLLTAERCVGVNENGEAVMVPDWGARERGIRLVVEYNEGKATERPDVKESKKVNFDTLRANCLRSPAYRAALRSHLGRWEEEANGGQNQG